MIQGDPQDFSKTYTVPQKRRSRLFKIYSSGRDRLPKSHTICNALFRPGPATPEILEAGCVQSMRGARQKFITLTTKINKQRGNG